MATDVQTFISHLDGGTFQQQMAKALSDVAAGVVVHEKAGRVNIEMTVKQIGSGSQVMVDHKLKYVCPTSKGSRSEDILTGTPMHVGSNGDMSLMPINQEDMFDKKHTGAVTHLKSA